jgi:hypothetical protein
MSVRDFFAGMRARIAEIRRGPAVALDRAAPRIVAKLTADSRTRRGNVPSYGKFGDVKITARVEGKTINVNAAPWVMKKASELGQPAEWADIVREELHEAVGGKR